MPNAGAGTPRSKTRNTPKRNRRREIAPEGRPTPRWKPLSLPFGAWAALAAVLLYGGLLLANFEFIAHRFPAPFLAGAPFLRRYSSTIGGLSEYAANLFSQTYSRHWAGALAFTLLALAAWAIARGILRRFSPGSYGLPAAAFPGLILILASRYLPVSYILPMIAGLAAAWIYMALRWRLRGSRADAAVAVLFLSASIPLYFLTGSGLLYFCAASGLFEFLVRKQPAWGVVWAAFGAAVPYGMSYAYYEPDIASRYFRWMTRPQPDVLTNGLMAAMYLFVPAGTALAFLNGRFRIGARLRPGFRRAVRIAEFVAVALLAARLVALERDRSGWIYADYLLDEGRTDEAAAMLAQSPDDSDPIRFRTFYALARKGRVLWEMFHYPQSASSDALLFQDPKWDAISGVAAWRSDVYLELGRINDSQRWAHEAMASQGETPRLLERMALVYILNGNPEAAKTFLRALETVPFQKERARQQLDALERGPGMLANPLAARIRPLMLRKDYVGTWNTAQILRQCLEANPSNRMAFEYLLAHYLLTSDMEGFAAVAPRLKDFYLVLPTHVQEALLSFANVHDALPPGVDAGAIDPRLARRFQMFLSMYLARQNSPEAGWQALAPEFGDTYWFFYVFGRTAAGEPPRAAALQKNGGAR
jgi:hypothetical protein